MTSSHCTYPQLHTTYTTTNIRTTDSALTWLLRTSSACWPLNLSDHPSSGRIPNCTTRAKQERGSTRYRSASNFRCSPSPKNGGLRRFLFLKDLWWEDRIFHQQTHCLQKGSLFLLRWSHRTVSPSPQAKRALRDSDGFSEGGQVDGFCGHWYLFRTLHSTKSFVFEAFAS